MEAICSSETYADFQRTTRRYIPEDRTHNHSCGNLISYNFKLGRRRRRRLLKSLRGRDKKQNYGRKIWKEEAIWEIQW
jgi:hypothetical protein